MASDLEPYCELCVCLCDHPCMNEDAEMDKPRTLYLNNLNERVPHRILNAEITKLVAQFAEPVSVYTGRSLRRRGQAFVAFKTSQDAVNVLEHLNHHKLFDKILQVAYAKSDSDVNTSENERAERQSLRKKAKLHESGSAMDTDPGHYPPSNKPTETSDENASRVPAPAPPVPAPSFGEPHNVLLLQKIPDTITVADLQQACSQFEGFTDARMFAVKHVGFIDFSSVESAAAAISTIASLGIGNVTYAKK